MPIVRVTIKSANRPIISRQIPKTATRRAHRPRWRGHQIGGRDHISSLFAPPRSVAERMQYQVPPLRENRKIIQITGQLSNLRKPR
jgi:hypothetical protein